MRVATVADWVARLADAHHARQLQSELTRLGRYPLIVVTSVVDFVLTVTEAPAAPTRCPAA